jgi:hypothetical protein
MSIIGTRIGACEIASLVGAGGMSEVYRPVIDLPAQPLRVTLNWPAALKK